MTIHGSGFPVDKPRLPEVTVGDTAARTVYASPSTISVLVPAGLDGGRTTVRVADVPGETALLEVGTPLATGLHQVDNPVFDREGNLYVTYSGTRGQDVPVSIFRVSPTGRRESYVSGIVNPTSMTFDAAGQLYVSSRFEGSIFRIFPNGTHEPYASDLGIACGLAFDRRGVLYVGDRSGTVFAVEPDRTVHAIATLPPSVAAFHIAVGPDDCVYVSGPTLGPYDHVYRVDPATGAIDRDVFGLRKTARDCVRLAGFALRDGGARRIQRALPCEDRRQRRTGGVRAVSRRGRVQSERRACRGVERHGIQARRANSTAHPLEPEIWNLIESRIYESQSQSEI